MFLQLYKAFVKTVSGAIQFATVSIVAWILPPYATAVAITLSGVYLIIKY